MSRALRNVGVLATVVVIGLLVAGATAPAGAQDFGCRIPGTQAPVTYTDPDPDGYQQSIDRVTLAGVMNPCLPKMFCPLAPVSRGEMAYYVEVARRHGSPGWQLAPATGVFKDVPPDYPLGCWVELMKADNITAGCDTDTYLVSHSVRCE